MLLPSGMANNSSHPIVEILGGVFAVVEKMLIMGAIAVVLLICVLIYGVVEWAISPAKPTYTCTKSHDDVVVSHVGSYTIQRHNTVCDQLTRKN